MRQVLVGFLLAVALAPTTAWAHGDVTTSAPAPGGRVKEPPTGVSISFSEPPTKDSKYSVVDGCGDEVLTGVEGKGTDKTLVISGGSSGRWKVSYNVISALDGHRSSDRFTFTVAGKKDCEPDDQESPDPVATTPPQATDEEPASFPILPVAVGAAIVAAAVAFRLLASR